MSEATDAVTAGGAVGLVGTFDVRNYGDLLFPLIAGWRLAQHGLAVEAYSPRGGSVGWQDAAPCRPLADLPRRAPALEALLIGGGNIVHLADAALADYPGAMARWAYPALWAGTGVVAATANKPLLWNAPGLPRTFDTADAQALLRPLLKASDYVAVRDRYSLDAMGPQPDVEIAVVPDTAAELARMWPLPVLGPAFAVLAARKGMDPAAPHAAIHIKRRSVENGQEQALAAGVDSFARRSGLTPLLVAIGPCHRDDEMARTIGGLLTVPHVRLDDPLGLKEIAAAIAHARCYVGCSLHGYVSATAYGVPGRIVGVPSLGKHAGFLEQVGRPGDLFGGWPQALEPFPCDAAAAAAGVPDEVLGRLDRHWERIAELVRNPLKGQYTARTRYLRRFAGAALETGGWAWAAPGFGLAPEPATTNGQATAPASPTVVERYQGFCCICGKKGVFDRGEQRSVREAYPCPFCRASLRYRDQAAAILDEFAAGTEVSLNRLAQSGRMDRLHIYEPALHGPFVRAFSALPHYRRSYYWDGARPGQTFRGVPFEDLCALSLPSESVDLVVTSDVLEHVFEPFLAFAEIHRVLKPGGVHVFTIPTAWPIAETSVTRARMRDGEPEHLLPERYHRAGDGSPSLVVTDFGADLAPRLAELGFDTQVQRRNIAIDPLYRNATFISRRMR